MKTGKLTVKHQVTIPADVRAALGLKAGDHVAFDVEDGKATIRKTEPIDWAWHAALSGTLQEWNSPEDDEAFRDL